MVTSTHKMNSIVTIMAFILMASSSMAQDDWVKVKVKHTPVLKKGDTLTIQATLSIQENYYLYAPTDDSRDAGFQVTQFQFEPRLPAGLYRFGGSRSLTGEGIEPLMHIRGQGNTISQQFIYKGGNPGKEIIIAGSFVYQACDQTTCYPPVSLPIECKIKLK